MKIFIKEIICNISEKSISSALKIDDEDKFREVWEWDEVREDKLLSAINHMIPYKINKEELQDCKTVNHLLYIVDTDGKGRAGDIQ